MRFFNALNSCFLLFAVVLLASCAGTTRTATHTAELDSDDLAVIASVCEHYVTMGSLWAPNKSGAFVAILSETQEPPFKPGGFGPWYRNEDAATRHFESRNDLTFRLPQILRHGRIALLGIETAHSLVRQGTFDETFPDHRGYLYFWLPGYNPDSTEAVVYVYHGGSDSHEGAIMFGDLVRLEKIKGQWVVADVQISWRS